MDDWNYVWGKGVWQVYKLRLVIRVKNIVTFERKFANSQKRRKRKKDPRFLFNQIKRAGSDFNQFI